MYREFSINEQKRKMMSKEPKSVEEILKDLTALEKKVVKLARDLELIESVDKKKK